MNDFYAAECGLDYDKIIWEEQVKRDVNVETLIQMLQLNVLSFNIDFEEEKIYYCFDVFGETQDDTISLNEYFKFFYKD